jgi:hypothetical protein
MFSFTSSNAASLEELDLNDVIQALQFTTDKLDLEDEENVESIKKMILVSAGVIEKLFPEFSKKPLNEDHELV